MLGGVLATGGQAATGGGRRLGVGGLGRTALWARGVVDAVVGAACAGGNTRRLCLNRKQMPKPPQPVYVQPPPQPVYYQPYYAPAPPPPGYRAYYGPPRVYYGPPRW
ncbi:hypothetical protein [Pseudomonas juntendi]|uniref:hypothetical protein n=1 Tax=Pseudomonas juntendi TaxID=2666183 RepID=UPI00301C3ED7